MLTRAYDRIERGSGSLIQKEHTGLTGTFLHLTTAVPPPGRRHGVLLLHHIFGRPALDEFLINSRADYRCR